jgi:hypothetical protein
MTFDTQVAAIVPDDHMISNPSPFSGCVKPLIEYSIESKGIFTNLTIQSKILEAILKRFKLA